MRNITKHRIFTSLALVLILSFASFDMALANSASSPGQAASLAKATYGGKVLSSKDAGKAYRVKLLLKNGRVKTVSIGKGQ